MVAAGAVRWGCQKVKGNAQSEDLVCDLDIGLLVARLVTGNGGTDAAQLLVAVLSGMRGCVTVADLYTQ